MFFLSQGAAPGALTIAVPGVQPAVQEKEHEPGLAVLFLAESVTKIANLRLGISGLVLIGQNEPGCYDPHCAWGQ